ncbi:MAG: thiamine pyrophosphate-dependent dehydrogenase E1 component subunit alpha [Acidimicrobiales bacterium]
MELPFATTTRTAGAPTNPGRPTPAELYRAMRLVRRVEERLIEEYASRRIRMALHLSIGQEAVAVGVLLGARPTDTVVGTHRSHAVYLAKGGSLQAMVDEFYSLPTGCSRGVGGSMHLADPDVGMLGSSAVLGGGVPMAVGGAYAHARAGQGDVAFAFTGDGGVDEGSFWESLNLAALLALPVLFVVENNGYSTLTPQSARQARPDVVAKAAAFGVPSVRVDGNDALAVAGLTADLVSRLRAGGGPRLVEATTFRYVAHVGVTSDRGTGRPESEWDAWPDCDPLVGLARSGLVDDGERAAIHAGVEVRVEAAFGATIAAFEAHNAVERLEAPPAPDPSRV